MKTVKFDANPRCPKCGALLDAATATTPGRQTPTEGDYSLCVYCEAILRFASDLSLVEIPMSEVTPDVAPEMKRALHHLRLFKRENGDLPR